MKLETLHLSWQAAAVHIVKDISLSVGEGELVGLIGPNGSGKSTLLRMIYRVLRPSAGSAVVDGSDVWRLSARENARRMAVLAQEQASEFGFSVRDMVLMGRIAHRTAFERDRTDDFEIVERAMQRVGVAHLAERSFGTLSGGERQRVLIARALAQEAQLLVLDEPTNHLDVRQQFEIMNLIRNLGLTAIAALHELHIAAHYCDRLFLLQAGCLVHSGSPQHVLTESIIASVYGVSARVAVDARTGRPRIEFLPDEPCCNARYRSAAGVHSLKEE